MKIKKYSREDVLHLSLLILVILLAGGVRLAGLGNYPSGLNHDEAYAGYEAWSLLQSGMDSHGYHNPVYFVSWGSGMNVMESYLMIPFMAVLGRTVAALRLPQAILGWMGVVSAYFLGKELKDRNFGLTLAALLAINPWHIMLSRWGLESNLVIFFLITGMLMFVKGLNNNRYFYAAAVLYGLALYCYATIWIILPVYLLLAGIYALYTGKISWRCAGICVAIVGVLALPLLLFLAINFGILPEIRTPVLSIPRLLGMRNGEYSLKSVLQNVHDVFFMLTSQSDGNYYNAIPEFGMHYLFSMPFILFGFSWLLTDLYRGLKKGERGTGDDRLILVLFMLLAVAPPMLLLKDANINKINALHFWMVFACAYGIRKLGKLLPGSLLACLLAYTLAFSGFCSTYFSAGVPSFETQGIHGAMEAAEDAQLVYCADVLPTVVLFYDGTPTQEYLDTVVYSNYPDPFLETEAFGKYRFDPNPDGINPSAAYICKAENGALREALEQQGFIGEEYGHYICYMPIA